MSRLPTIDGRDDEELRQRTRELAESYTDDWDPDAGGPGTALLHLFGDLAAGVTGRLDRVPEKHRVSFFDTLGFGRAPPQSARLPLSFAIADGVSENVVIPESTQAIAAATDDRPEQRFQVSPGEGFEATPANVAQLYGVDGKLDDIYDHTSLAESGVETKLFRGDDVQEHALHLGHDDLLDLTPESTIRVALTTDVASEQLRRNLDWEYYGTVGDGEEKWHPLSTRTDEGPTSPVGTGPKRDPLDEFTPKQRRFYEGFLNQMAKHGYEIDEDLPLAKRREIHERIRAVVSEREFSKFRPDGRDEYDLSETLARFVLPTTAVETGLVEDIAKEVRTIQTVQPVSVRFLPDGGEGETTTGGAGSEATSGETTVFELRLPENGEIAKHEVDGIEGLWIRCLPKSVFAVTVESVSLGATADELTPAVMLFNDVPLTADSGDIYPLGNPPPRPAEFYVASDEAFSTPDVPVTVEFHGTDTDPPPKVDAELSWEYWNGNRWANLSGEFDPAEVRKLTRPGTFEFTVPDSLEPTAVSGQEAHWIRVRLVNRDYGWKPGRNGSEGHSPKFANVTLDYGDTEKTAKTPPQHVVRYNNLDYDQTPASEGDFRPFLPVSDESQTLYFGFDRTLRDGPIPLYVAAADETYRDDFHPAIRWEYCADPEQDRWVSLDVRDETESLTRRGIVELSFPEDTTEFERFGTKRHWIRARVSKTDFGTSAPLFERKDAEQEYPGFPKLCRRHQLRGAALRGPVDTPPELFGLHLNTGWAANVTTVEDEILGSSDGTESQRFTVATPPAREETVWVDEVRGLSEGQREALESSRPDDVEVVTDAQGTVQSVWVRWTRVEDFLTSEGDDRHYVLDSAAGTITFGDGDRGRIPPTGAENVRVSYQTGGGQHGNVAVGTVTELASSVAFVEEVTNPAPGDGGAEVESIEAVLATAPKQLRDRGRAVTVPDFERLAMAAARKLARAKCIPGLDVEGNRTRGWVTVLVVPQSGDRKPVPTATLKDQIETFLAGRAPATLVDCDHLVIRGPSYVSVTVEATLSEDGTLTRSALEATATRRVEAFLHPLSGGETGEGWDFGELPCLSDFYAILERVEGVDHVADLSVRIDGLEDRVRLAEGSDRPTVSPDVLVSSGTHAIDVTEGP